MNKLSHIDSDGKAQMVDVSSKTIQKRTAKAFGKIFVSQNTIAEIKANNLKKGDVLGVAKIAGIQAAKNTSNLIPLCHPLMISKVDVNLKIEENFVSANSEVICSGQTGVEMEALTAVSVALLTVYDMCKAIDKEMTISDIKLLSKVKEDIK